MYPESPKILNIHENKNYHKDSLLQNYWGKYLFCPVACYELFEI